MSCAVFAVIATGPAANGLVLPETVEEEDGLCAMASTGSGSREGGS